MKTSPTQLHQCCFFFLLLLLIKVRIIVVLHPVSSCWYSHLFLLIFFCLTINNKVVLTLEVGLFSQRGMAYSCVSHGQLFLPGFLLLIEPYSLVSGAIKCNKEYLTTMSSLTQDNDHQSSDVLLLIWECDRVERRVEKRNK